jgi:2-oxoisovalerate ferredoxin oxidoreductase beta subunit
MNKRKNTFLLALYLFLSSCLIGCKKRPDEEIHEVIDIIPPAFIGDASEETKDDVEIISIPAREIATEMGNAKAMNTAILGALMELGKDSPILSQDAFAEGIKETFAAKPKLIDINLKVLDAGAKWLRENK